MSLVKNSYPRQTLFIVINFNNRIPLAIKVEAFNRLINRQQLRKKFRSAVRNNHIKKE